MPSYYINADGLHRAAVQLCLCGVAADHAGRRGTRARLIVDLGSAVHLHARHRLLLGALRLQHPRLVPVRVPPENKNSIY